MPRTTGDRITVSTITGPAYWVSALVNGDRSGLTEDDRTQLDAWLARQGNPMIVGTADDAEPRFTWDFDLYAPECGVRGGEVIDYIVHTWETPDHA